MDNTVDARLLHSPSLSVERASAAIQRVVEVLNPQAESDEMDAITKRATHLGLYSSGREDSLGSVPGYESLELVLAMAYQHAACSKGKERHASGLPFHQQPMQRESDDLGTAAGLIYQARKKVREGSKLPTERAQIAEMVGAINYIAGWIIWTLRQPQETPEEV